MTAVVRNLTRRHFLLAILTVTAWLVPSGLHGEDPAASFTREEKECFLSKAKIVKTRSISVGVTGSLRATLSDGRVTHDAHIQCIDFFAHRYPHKEGVELLFKDSYKFNIAAYRLALLLGLDNVPPSVQRSFQRQRCAYTWWVDEVMMDEKKRQEQKIQPPDPLDWDEQMCIVNVFDQLISNIDRNQGNLLITQDWRMWMIDHTRSFRPFGELGKPDRLTRCERGLFERLKELEIDEVRGQLGAFLTKSEIQALMARRELIVQRLESLGEKALFDRGPNRGQPK
jgi:hypothetical protein